MTDSLKIFISHKMPSNTDAATKIGNFIGGASGDAIKVVGAWQFRYGENFREKIRQELATTDIFILLYTGDDADWSYCLWECGIFESTAGATGDKSIIVMHDADIRPPAVLQMYVSLPFDRVSIKKFLTQLYVGPPWGRAPSTPDSILDILASNIETSLSRPEVYNFELSPSFVISLELTSATKSALRDRKIPDEAFVSGVLEWHKLFGKELDSGGWPWGELTRGWPNKVLYGYEFARMISAGLERNAPEGTLLRSGDGELYYIRLRRYEDVIKSTNCNFMFSAFKLDTPIYGSYGGAKEDEILAYNLVNACWYARRRLIDCLYRDVLRTLIEGAQNDIEKTRSLIEDINDELIKISVQSNIRNITNILDNSKLFPLVSLVEDRSLVNALKKRINDASKAETYDVKAIADALYEFSKINLEYYKISADKFAQTAAAVSLPESPDDIINASVFHG